VAEVLRTATTRLGDYSDIVLGQAWDVLAGLPKDAKNLAGEIVRRIEFHESRRIVVFLPPTGDRLDIFVGLFQSAFQRKFSNGKSFDFRSNGGKAPDQVFKNFAQGDASKDSPHVLLTIDRFSEGVSVNDIDLMVMLRPTLSPRVAVQQVGRGVRLFSINGHKKTKCIILDAVYFQHRWDEWNSVQPEKIDISAVG
jgi:hypothetical protein